MRIVIRILAIVLPWVVLFVGFGAVFQPKSAAEWLMVHWFLIPFIPVYALLLFVAFRLTRLPLDPPFIRKLKVGRHAATGKHGA